MAVFAANMKAERLAQNLSQENLARLSNVSQQAISLIEAGKRSPTEDTMAMIAEGLGCTVNYLLTAHKPVQDAGDDFSTQELKLVREFRKLSDQGKEYLFQQLAMASKVFPGQSDPVSSLAE